MKIRIVYNKLLGGWYVVRGPHQTPLAGRFETKEAAKAYLERHKAPAAQAGRALEQAYPWGYRSGESEP